MKDDEALIGELAEKIGRMLSNDEHIDASKIPEATRLITQFMQAHPRMPDREELARILHEAKQKLCWGSVKEPWHKPNAASPTQPWHDIAYAQADAIAAALEKLK